MSSTTPMPESSAPGAELDPGSSPVGSAGRNADSASLNGIEVGEAHDDQGESEHVAAQLMHEATAALRHRREEPTS